MLFFIFCGIWPCVNRPTCVSSISILASPFSLSSSSSEMFDWDDAELANIIWDEAAETGDHIVPYPRGIEDCRNKKEWKEEAAVIRPTEQKNRKAKVDLPGKIPEGSSSVVKQDELSMCGIDQLDEDAGTHQNSHEGKEQGDFVDYGWANIGSFDDFDRIFSNNDAVFGHVSLGNPDELWSSSRDVANTAAKSLTISSELPSLGQGTLSNTSQELEIKTEYVQDDLSCGLHYGKTDDSTSQSLRSVHEILEHVEDAGGKSKPIAKKQTDLDMLGQTTIVTSRSAADNIANQNEVSTKLARQKKPLKSRKRMQGKSEGTPVQELYGSWSSLRNPSGQLENRLAHAIIQPSPSSVQQMQLLGPELFQYQHISNQFAACTVYGNLTNQYPAMPVLSHIQHGKPKHQPLHSSHDVSPASRNPVKSAEAPVKPVSMTPQEKIEKLRRRQQLQAMLAIRKQQQQLRQQISSTNHSATQNCPQENQSQQFGGADPEVEDLNTFHCLEPNSPVEQHDSSTISAVFDDYSLEETIFNRLQDIIRKLDMKVKLCIRDSLFRLAQSTMQRQYASDTSRTNMCKKDEHDALAKEEINSYNRLPDGETETNPIDRTVAHLLFYRPMELSGKQAETSESPQHRAAAVMNFPETFSDKQCFGPQDLKVCSPLVKPDQYKESPCIDASENASNNGLTESGTVVVESSQ